MSLIDIQRQLDILTDRLDESIKFVNEASRNMVAVDQSIKHLGKDIDEMKEEMTAFDRRVRRMENRWTYTLGIVGAILFIVQATMVILSLVEKVRGIK